MSDYEKILAYLEALNEDGDVIEKPTSLILGDRRFVFNDSRELVLIQLRSRAHDGIRKYRTIGRS